jgi:hypothetical protein
MIAPDQPFLYSVKKRWIPPEMTTAPALDPNQPANGIEPHYALLINPFYAKDANASFGKHVLTPTLALTSFAATTPPHWRVSTGMKTCSMAVRHLVPCRKSSESRCISRLRTGLMSWPTGIERAARK